MSIGFAAFPFLPHEPEALTWEQTLELADYALRLTKRRKRNSYTGLRAGAGLSAAAVLAFLSAGREAPLPPDLEIVLPEKRRGRTGKLSSRVRRTALFHASERHLASHPQV